MANNICLFPPLLNAFYSSLLWDPFLFPFNGDACLPSSPPDRCAPCVFVCCAL